MSWVVVSLLIALGLFFSAFFSGAETGLYCINRLRLHLGAGQRDPRALRIATVLQDPQGALSVTLVGTNLMNYVTTASVAFLLGDLMGFGELDTELYTIVILTPVVFVFCEVVPKNLFRLHADRLLASSSRLLAVADRTMRLTGAVWFLKILTRTVGRLTGGDFMPGGPSDPKQRMTGLLQEALAGRTLGADFSGLIERVCRLSETPLHSVMVPRNRVVTIAAGANRRELLRVARRTRYAYLPVFETHRHHIIGAIRVEELLMAEGWSTVGENIAPAVTLNPHDTVASAIAALLAGPRPVEPVSSRLKTGPTGGATLRSATRERTGGEMGIVTDRGGQMLGIVALRDLIEAVVGEMAADD